MFFHSGRSVRARILAVAADGRRRWRRRRRAAAIRTTSPSAKRKSSPPPGSSRAIRQPPQQQAAEPAKFLSEVQSKLRDQALSLAGRMQSRELSEAESRSSTASSTDMNAAAQAMGPASDKLKQQKWTRRDPERAKGAAISAARRSHVPPDSKSPFGSRRRRWRRRRQRGPRSCEPFRSRARHRKKSVRNRADRRSSADQRDQGNRRRAARSSTNWPAASRNWPTAAQQQRAELPGALAAGNAAARRRRVAAADGAARPAKSAERPAGFKRSIGTVRAIRSVGPIGAIRSIGPVRAKRAVRTKRPIGQQGSGDPRVQQALDRLRQAN